jgi:Cys-tRNA(Pro)/Cys-tRNA(Cys) deacylase
MVTGDIILDNIDLQKYLENTNTTAKILAMSGRVHSVMEASKELGEPPGHFIKTIVFTNPDKKIILAIVKGTDRASSKRIGKAIDVESPRVTTPKEALMLTGYEVGGTPPISIPKALVLIDPKVMEMETVFGGGGTDHHLLKITPDEILELTNAKIVRVRK